MIRFNLYNFVKTATQCFYIFSVVVYNTIKVWSFCAFFYSPQPTYTSSKSPAKKGNVCLNKDAASPKSGVHEIRVHEITISQGQGGAFSAI